MTEPIISLSGAGKRYRQYKDSAVLVSKGLGRIRRTRLSHLWALRHIDLDVATGERIGVIGRNGGGKTTMLQLIAGVSAPTEGRVAVRGRVAPLMAVGVGFHPELTGRENVYVNATILGRTRKQIDETFDGIVAFADIGSFIDTPIKFYSSGMVVRLGFAVATRSNPDVLLVDEVLAVGDVSFQARSFERLQELRADGTTVLIVSHNLHAIRLLCDRVVVLNQGEVAFDGDTHTALSVFHQLLDEAREPEDQGPWTGSEDSADGVHLTSLELFGPDGLRTGHVNAGEELTASVSVAGRPGQPSPDLELEVSSNAGVAAYRQRWSVPSGMDEAGALTCDVTFAANLPSGSYLAMVTLHPGGSAGVLSRAGPISFYVSGRREVHGLGDLGVMFAPAEPAGC